MSIDKFNICVQDALSAVYDVGHETQIERFPDSNIFLKREDRGPIGAYKWRGAYTAMRHAFGMGARDFVAASAGNHAQGVALAAKKLGVSSTIFMPRTAPQAKQDRVLQHGNGQVEIRLFGDSYDETANAAKLFVQENNATFIHPFDDIHTIAGQATIAEEILKSANIPDILFLQIGGGGMAAGVSGWLKQHNPNIRIIGVEEVGQASMTASIQAGHPVTLENTSIFCDGTAVKTPGDLTFEMCSRNIDEFITVQEREIYDAYNKLYKGLGILPEPSGIIGLAGIYNYIAQHPDDVAGKNLMGIITGANLDLSRVAQISTLASTGQHNRRYLQFALREQAGSLLQLLETALSNVNVHDFRYGKSEPSIGYPVIGFEASDAELQNIVDILNRENINYCDVTEEVPTQGRGIVSASYFFTSTQFYHISFPERENALRDLLRSMRDAADIHYFDYAYSGENVGRALMGFDVKNPQKFQDILDNSVVNSTPASDFEVGLVKGSPCRHLRALPKL